MIRFPEHFRKALKAFEAAGAQLCSTSERVHNEATGQISALKQRAGNAERLTNEHWSQIKGSSSPNNAPGSLENWPALEAELTVLRTWAIEIRKDVTALAATSD